MSVTVMETELGEQSASGDVLLRAWQDMDVPDGWRAEIINGAITVMPPPSIAHNRIGTRVNKALVRAVPDDWGVHQTLGLSIPRIGELYVPDFVVIPDAAVEAAQIAPSAEDALLVVEIVSKHNAEQDRKKKLWGYAHGQVPLYLLIDAWEQNGPTVVLYEQPQNGRYHHATTVEFGDSIILPKPFDLELDTSEFPPPQEWK